MLSALKVVHIFFRVQDIISAYLCSFNMDRFVIKTIRASNASAKETSDKSTLRVGHPQPRVFGSGEEENSASSSTGKAIRDNNANDLAQKGEPIKQIILPKYPKNEQNRCFRSEWFQQFKWLEYSPTLDAAFCYPCRQFVSVCKEDTYTQRGFRNWKAALDRTKAGFYKHASSEIHVQAMVMWSERINRVDTNRSVSTLVNDSVLDKHRYYIASIVEIIQFLVVNELPVRGTYNIVEHVEECLFKNLFEFTLRKDAKLADACKIIPKNATYQSPDIQNEIIQVMTDLIKEEVSGDVRNADVPFFTLLEDGTKDKNRRENIALGVRFVKDGKICECMLSIESIETTSALDAETFADTTLDSLLRYDLNPKNMLSQCYDGASVMSGKKGGVQALIQKKLKKEIPYVHCFNHRLHLVIIKAVEVVSIVKEFFGQCGELYNFLSRGIVAALYKGKALSRLLEQRWSGHLHVCRIIFEEYHHISETLELISVNQEREFGGDDVALSTGLHIVMKKQEFVFCLVIMKNILEILSPVDKGLQSHDISLEQAYSLVQAAKCAVENLRNDDSFKSTLEEMSKLSKVEDMKIKRKRKLNSLLDDYVVHDTIGHRSSNITNKYSEYAPVFYEILDVVLAELKRRFQDNDNLHQAIIAAENLDCDNDKLKYLKQFGIVIPSKEEMKVAKHLLEKSNTTKQNFFSEIYKHRSAFEDCYSMLAAVRTFACSTAICESTFSVLTRINRPQRLSMSHSRMANLVYLAFEQRRTKNLNVEKVLRRFHSLKDRRLQLY